MIRFPLWGMLLAALGPLSACAKSDAASRAVADSALLGARAARLQQLLSNIDTIGPDQPIALWKLPDRLKEISGLALTADGRLLTHGDEHGTVFEIDYRRGEVVKSFTVGSPRVRGDFEAITIVRDSVLLLASDGVLYSFKEGADKSVVPFVKRDTGLGKQCEFEGMTFDSLTNLLLLACKHVRDKALKGNLVIFRLPMGPDRDGKEVPPSPLVIPFEQAIGSNDWTDLRPSDITIDPVTGNYVLVASIEKALLAITPTGEVVFSRPLPKDHDQAEGIAITRDHLLIISDEAKTGPARITLYRWP